MTPARLAPHPLALGVALALLHLGSAQAQGAAPAAPATENGTAAADDGLKLDEIVVTATSVARSKMDESLSVSSVDIDQIVSSQPTNASDVLRNIPGVHVESSGGGGNANVTVRGLPISAGGSRYVQFQEDGLPVLLFGDIAFATPDMFLRVDQGLERVEVVRGGSASTLATNSPGGVINFISRTGEEKSATVQLTEGLSYNESRVDFAAGGPVADRTRAFVAGFYVMGEGVRNATHNAEQGGALHGNITHDFANGFLRLSFKHLDDQMPLFMPAPVQVNGGSISQVPGIDPRLFTGYSPYWVTDYTLSKNNTLVGSNVNSGQTIKSDSVGLEAQIRAEGFTIDERFRSAHNGGRFISIFPADNVAAAPAGATYATGPNAGKAYAGSVFTATVFNTSLDDLGAATNDLKVSRQFELAGGDKLTGAAGVFLNAQKVSLTWNFNQYLMQATDNNAALIADTATNAYGAVALGTNVWGGCCTRAIDAEYITRSPYAALTYDTGPVSVDASLRYDHQDATGSYNQAVAQQFDPANQKDIDYSVHHTSYSLGVNDRLGANLAVFARISDGVAFNADRIMFGSAALSGGSPIPLNEVKQYEAGAKWRQDGLSLFATLFQAKTKESNYDATTQVSTANSYDAKGLELEAAWHAGNFHVIGGATYTTSKITDSLSASLVGTPPNRLAKVVYQLTPSYEKDNWSVGAAIFGNTASTDSRGSANQATLPGYATVNLFGTYHLTAQATATLGVNNLFDTLGYTESNDGRMAARSITGRSVRAGLQYSF